MTNDTGDQSILVWDVAIKPRPHCPHASAVSAGLPESSRYQATVNVPVQLDATGSFDPDSDPLTFAWDMHETGQFADATGPTPSWTFTSPGMYAIAVQVTDHPEDNTNPYSASDCSTTDYRVVVVTQ